MKISEKPCVFISSTGRTGTQLFGKVISQMVDDCSSFHEPDATWVTRPIDWLKKISEEDAEYLIGVAQQIIDMLSGG